MKNISSPKNIHFQKDLAKDSCCYEKENLFHNTFIAFKSIENIFYLIYINKNNSIISYDIEKNQIINEIKNAHKSTITSIYYYFNKNEKRDLIISISMINSNIKLWNIINWSIVLDLKKIYEEGFLQSACFLETNNDIYIITSNFNYSYTFYIEPIKIYNLKGNKIKEINESKDITFYIDAFYDSNVNKNYIITGNTGNAKSYDYEENKIYHMYFKEDNIYRIYHNVLVNESHNDGQNVLYFIGLSNDNYIRMWNFHSGELLRSIFVKNDNLLSYNMIFSMCVWNENYFFVGSSDESLKLLKTDTGEIVKNLNDINCEIIALKKLVHPLYGECLISQSRQNSQIKLWTFHN